MVMKSGVIACALGAWAALTVPCSAASATDGASTRIRLQGVVPTICRAQFSSGQATTAGSVVDLGVLSELCNNMGGYRVVLRHAAGLDSGTVTVDGRTMPLSSTGLTVITDASGPAVASKSVSIDFGGDAPSYLGLMIQPKGPVF